MKSYQPFPCNPEKVINPAIFLLLALFCGCGKQPQVNQTLLAKKAATETFVQPQFEDVTQAAGIRWTHNPCRTGKKYLPETVGGGGGFIDYDNDGWLDIILINGAPLPGYKGPAPSLALYHNNHDGTFTEVSQKVGLTLHEYGMGVAVGDYDNDGWPDLYITAVGQAHLFHNEHGRFVDVTAQAGVGCKGFSTAAAWVDYNRDGKLDLFVGRYVDWTPETDLPCGPPTAREYCPPNQYHGAPPVLYHNLGHGVFEDVSKKAGVLGNPSKTLAVIPYDFNGDGWPDLYLANDTEPDVLLINNRNGTFTNRALEAGVALGTDGNPTGSMGADVAVPLDDGRPCIAVGTFAGQEMSLFLAAAGQTNGQALFENRKAEAGVAAPTHNMTTFGLVWADVDLDGWPDLMVMNGHIDMDQALGAGGGTVAYRQPPQLFQNRRDGTFRDVASAAGIAAPIVGRGLAVGDYDNDGKPDFLFFENGGPVRLWRNRTATKGHWIGLRLIGTRSPKDGAGAMVTLSGSGWTQTRCATTARSFLSACDPRVHFGLGDRMPDQLTVHWPSGKVTQTKAPPIDRYLTIKEE